MGGLLTVEGGKWTTSRHLAERVVDHLVKTTTLPVDRSISARQYLQGCAIRDVDVHINRLKRRHPDFEGDTLDNLGRLYGTACEAVLELARQDRSLASKLNSDGELLAQAVYAVRHEMARTLQDIVLRRTGIATLGHPGQDVLRRVARAVADDLGWDDGRIRREVAETTAFLRVPAE